MQKHAESLGKAERHRLIKGVVARKRVGTQLELAAALAAAGCQVTQATISRDIRELRLEKTHDAFGRPRYTLPQEGGRARSEDPREVLAALLAQFGRHAAAAQNIVVLHSEIGSAPAIGRHSTASRTHASSARSPATTRAS